MVIASCLIQTLLLLSIFSATRRTSIFAFELPVSVLQRPQKQWNRLLLFLTELAEGFNVVLGLLKNTLRRFKFDDGIVFHRLLAHELQHVSQTSDGGPLPFSSFSKYFFAIIPR